MRWRNHSLVSGALALGCGCHPSVAALIAVCATLPDRIETLPGTHGTVRLLAHRGRSHDLIVWGAACALAIAVQSVLPAHVRDLVGDPRLPMPLWAVPAGGILHLMAGDVFTPGGIRIGPKRIACPLFTTGTLAEEAYTLVMASVFIAARLLPL